MKSLLQDLRYALRLLVRNPGFTAVAVLTLGLGIGANTAIFSVIKALLLLPLPYRDAGRVAFVLGWNVREDSMRFSVSEADFLDLSGQSQAFEAMSAYRYWSANLAGVDEPERVQGYRVTANLFDLLGVPALSGRTFRAEEGEEGRDRVAVLSHGLWKRRFAASTRVVGQALLLDDQTYTIIGVMPPRFEFPQVNYKGDLWVPLSLRPGARADGGGRSLVAVARLKPGRLLAEAQAEMNALTERLEREFPETNRGAGVRVIPMQEMAAQYTRPALLALAVAVGLLLLIACANVANLFLARAVGRTNEMALRTVLGASRLRLAQQLLTESVLLALLGGALGILVAAWALDALLARLPDFWVSVMPAVLEIGMDPAVVGFTLALSIATGLGFGIAPALHLSRSNLAEPLKETRSGGGARRHRLRTVLVVGEVALSLTLLIAAGLLLQTFLRLLQVDPGFSAEKVLVADVALRESRYPDDLKRSAFFQEVLRRATALPGVEASGVVNRLPLSTGNEGASFEIEGRPIPLPGESPSANFRIVSPDYFRTMGIPLRRGRVFTDLDHRQAAPVAVISETLARLHWPDVDPIGQRLRFDNERRDAPWCTIVGIVGDVRHWALSESPQPEVHVPLTQDVRAEMTLVVRTSGAPAGLARGLQQAVQAVDPRQPTFNVKTMPEVVSRSLLMQAWSTSLVGLFASAALMLAALGLYGVLSYTVSERTRDLGIYMALGADGNDVLGLVLRRGLLWTGIGLGLGLALAAAVSQLLRGLLFGIGPNDPLTFATVALFFLAVALLACYVPARRATQVDPATALRHS